MPVELAVVDPLPDVGCPAADGVPVDEIAVHTVAFALLYEVDAPAAREEVVQRIPVGGCGLMVSRVVGDGLGFPQAVSERLGVEAVLDEVDLFVGEDGVDIRCCRWDFLEAEELPVKIPASVEAHVLAVVAFQNVLIQFSLWGEAHDLPQVVRGAVAENGVLGLLH